MYDNPLECSCLENPRDGRAWWAAFYGDAQTRTRLSCSTWENLEGEGGEGGGRDHRDGEHM